jgi:hypothetical protein
LQQQSNLGANGFVFAAVPQRFFKAGNLKAKRESQLIGLLMTNADFDLF